MHLLSFTRAWKARRRFASLTTRLGVQTGSSGLRDTDNLLGGTRAGHDDSSN
jgi:hypothetical protein